MSKLSGIYKIICINGKFYVGSSENIDRRLKDHIRLLNKNEHTNSYLQNAWNKYGEENFKYEIVENIHDINQLLTREQQWLNNTNCCNRKIGFNISTNSSAPNNGKLIDLTGQKFNRITIDKYVGKDRWGASLWLCKCECGNEKIIRGNSLKNGQVKSCGCLYKHGNNLKHNHTRDGKSSKTYKAWQNMIQRCTNPNNNAYNDYGGRGITVCKRWMKFENFLEDVGKISKDKILGRINNNKGYSPKNFKLSTMKEQNRSTRKNKLYYYKGKNQGIPILAEENKINKETLRSRLNKGLSIKGAIETPIKGKNK